MNMEQSRFPDAKIVEVIMHLCMRVKAKGEPSDHLSAPRCLFLAIAVCVPAHNR